MFVQENKNGSFLLEAENADDNNAICVISEMMYALAEQGRVSEDLANRHGGVQKGKQFRNRVTIPGMDFVQPANAPALLAEWKPRILKYDHEAESLRKKHGRDARDRRIFCQGMAEGIAWCYRELEKANAEHEPRAVVSRAPCFCSASGTKG